MAFSRIEVMPARSNMPLVERGRTVRTFMRLGPFAATVLLLGGGYLMTEALLKSVERVGCGNADGQIPAGVGGFPFGVSASPRRRIETALREKMHAMKRNGTCPC